MSDNDANLRNKHFADNWLTWAALHHFLPASLLRELVCVIVEQMSNGSISITQLFDESATQNAHGFDSWVIKPLKTYSPLASYLQSRIRGFVWHSDPIVFSDSENVAPPNVISSRVVDHALELGAADFGHPEPFVKEADSGYQASFNQFVQAFKFAREAYASSTTDEFVGAIEGLLTSVELPLAAVILKHFGDLCADTDEWDKAQALYERANYTVSKDISTAWLELTTAISAIITQSKAAAMRTLQGTDAAADFLFRTLDDTKLSDNPLLFGNASFDAFVAALHSANNRTFPADNRAAVLLPPLLHHTHNISSALESWLGAQYTDAHRRFWAVLRRQIALGSATESRNTKALYARCMLDELDQTVDRRIQPNLFLLAIRLLIESGNTHSLGHIRWKEHLVENYVDQQCVNFVINHAQVYPGSRLERQMVALELFRVWIEQITADRIDVATTMLQYISSLAHEPSSWRGEQNVGGRSLEALQYVARQRPDLRYGAVSEVASVVCLKLSTRESWRDREVALDTASAYVDVFSKEELFAVLDLTFLLLDSIPPNSDLPVIRHALNLLTSQTIRDLARQTPELERRIVTAILRFGLQQENEYPRVLFYLHDFDQMLLRDDSVQDALRGVVDHIRQCAIKINTSNVVEHIQALLLTPTAAGVDGVKDALKGLTLIIGSVKDRHPSIALPFAYSPLLLLADRQEQIATGISVSLETFRSWLASLIDLIADLWVEAKNHPLIFATFSFPPATKPDSVIIHNWAYASLRLAMTLRKDDELQKAFAVAAEQPDLRDGIALARATRSAAGEDSSLDAEAIRTENTDAFYSALGRRLVVLLRLTDEQAREVCKVMVEQCFRLGPRSIDAAVFMSAVNLNLHEYVAQSNQSDYIRRLRNNRDLRLALAPILEMLRGDTR